MPASAAAALPRADSPSADRYIREREGETAWTMQLSEADYSRSVEKIDLPDEVAKRISAREHVGTQVSTAGAAAGAAGAAFDPNARAWDQELPANFKSPSLDE